MSLVKKTIRFAFGTLLSRVSGLARVSIVGELFGAGQALDAFLIAFRIPNLFREMLAEGALGNSFTSVYSGIASTSADRAAKFFQEFFYFCSVVAFVVSVLGIVHAEAFVHALTLMVGDRAEGAAFLRDATGLTRIMFPFLGLTMLSAVVMGVGLQRDKYFVNAVAPVVFNLSIIFGATILAPWCVQNGPNWIEDALGSKALVGLAAGVVLGGILQLMIQLWSVGAGVFSGFAKVIFKAPWSPDIKRTMILMLPMVVAASAGQINVVVNSNFATSLEAGAVSWLEFAFRLFQLPVGLFGVAVGSAMLPSIAASIERNKGEIASETSRRLQDALELVVWVLVPCTLFLLFTSTAVVRILYEYGRFTAEDTKATAAALQGYTLGVVGYGVHKVMTSFYFAASRTRQAMYISITGIAGNFLLNWLLVRKFGHVGLALTASIMLTFMAAALIAGVARTISWNWQMLRKSCLYLTALVICGCVAMSLGGRVVSILGFGQRVEALTHICLNGAIIGICTIFFARLRIGRWPTLRR